MQQARTGIKSSSIFQVGRQMSFPAADCVCILNAPQRKSNSGGRTSSGKGERLVDQGRLLADVGFVVHSRRQAEVPGSTRQHLGRVFLDSTAQLGLADTVDRTNQVNAPLLGVLSDPPATTRLAIAWAMRRHANRSISSFGFHHAIVEAAATECTSVNDAPKV
jgi:hypothetical protein